MRNIYTARMAFVDLVNQLFVPKVIFDILAQSANPWKDIPFLIANYFLE